MDEIDRLALTAELSDSVCELNHGSKDTTPHKAVDFIVLPMGQKDDSKDQKEFVIPICVECATALQEDEWTLLYCVECGQSAWVLQSAAKLQYTNLQSGAHYHMITLVGCPKCTNKLRGLFFMDNK